jgi:carbamoylphosphate synthase small subunit
LGISNSAGTSCEVSIQNNDIRGVNQSVIGTNAHTYIINSAATLSQNISGNTTNVNAGTKNIIFISKQCGCSFKWYPECKQQ